MSAFSFWLMDLRQGPFMHSGVKKAADSATQNGIAHARGKLEETRGRKAFPGFLPNGNELAKNIFIIIIIFIN
jgi:hypothetical protein